MQTLRPTLFLLIFLAACAGEKTQPAPTQTQPSTTSSAQTTSSEAAEAEKGVWAGQIRIDAHAGTATLNYVGAESGDWVPFRFRTDSQAGAKILAVCADEDLCEIEGAVRFLDEPPPENASAVGEIVSVDRVKKLPPER
ncbi:MAG TPA: hypothetical protein VKB93_06020 [Thermoanaerobaculia bacterium]|nr:hypothetical protein [Thermoanaerobaculia bacterium]